MNTLILVIVALLAVGACIYFFYHAVKNAPFLNENEIPAAPGGAEHPPQDQKPLCSDISVNASPMKTERTKLTEAEADALSTLAHIAVTTAPTLTIHGAHAKALLAYMSRLEIERNELRAAMTAEEATAISVRETLKTHIHELTRYADHMETCDVNTGALCSCGFTGLMKKGIAR